MNESMEKMVIRLGQSTYLDRRIAGVHPDGQWKWQYRCGCSIWCWEDWMYCPACGKDVVKTDGKFF